MSQDTSDKKSLGLSVYLGMAKYASPLTKARDLRRENEGDKDSRRISERQGASSVERPEGLLIWIHVGDLASSLPFVELMGRIQQSIENIKFLLTTSEPIANAVLRARLPDTAFHQYAPSDTPQGARAFLDHWKPDICLWAENRLPPVLLRETAQKMVPMVFVNAHLSSRGFKKMRWFPGLAGSLLNYFSSILAVDVPSAEQFLKLGVSAETVSVAGWLREGSAPLPCYEPDRMQIAKELHGRPVWLAAHIDEAEIAQVVNAHMAAARLSHRLVMILSPHDSRQYAAIGKRLTASGLNVAYRSDPKSLTPLTDVLFADEPGELGLWYRVAAVSFIGRSLSELGGQNPYEAAALGSAIIHGPNVDNFADIYFRLAEAGAAVEILSPQSLAEAITECLSPDKAAQLAHAAWLVSSEGSDTTDQVIEKVLEHLPFTELST